MAIQSGDRSAAHVHGRAGFSLMELLVALAVISIASWVFASFFFSSVVLARTAQNERVAQALAREQLQRIMRHPEQFKWLVNEPAQQGLFPVRIGDDDPPAGNPFEPPGAMPLDRAANERESNLYNKFRWQAYGRIPAENSPYVEVSLVVRWVETGRPRLLSLSGAVPRNLVEGQP